MRRDPMRYDTFEQKFSTGVKGQATQQGESGKWKIVIAPLLFNQPVITLTVQVSPEVRVASSKRKIGARLYGMRHGASKRHAERSQLLFLLFCFSLCDARRGCVAHHHRHHHYKY